MKQIMIRSNGEKLEVREVSPPIMVFTVDRKLKYPLPILDQIWDENTAREYIRDLKREPRFVRKV